MMLNESMNMMNMSNMSNMANTSNMSNNSNMGMMPLAMLMNESVFVTMMTKLYTDLGPIIANM